MSMDQIMASVQAMKEADGSVMTDDRLEEVFCLVKPHGNWKMPIDATIAKGLATEAEITTAVLWYAGGAPVVENLGSKWHVTGVGYYEWVGA